MNFNEIESYPQEVKSFSQIYRVLLLFILNESMLTSINFFIEGELGYETEMLEECDYKGSTDIYRSLSTHKFIKSLNYVEHP